MSQGDGKARLTTAFRRMGIASALHGQAISARAQLSPVDLECLDLIHMEGPVTAGQIAKRTRLTSGAVTGLIDRLEAKGYVERLSDPVDRRKVLVRDVSAAIAPIQALFVPMEQAMAALLGRYAEAELELIAGFMERATDIAERRVEELSKND